MDCYMISHKFKFICPRIGKNASSTLVSYFRRFDPSLIDEGHKSVLGDGFHSFLTGEYFQNVNHNEYYKFGFVRNPFDRLVSAYQEFKRPEQFLSLKLQIEKNPDFSLYLILNNFKKFIEMTNVYEHIHWKSQYQMLHHEDKLLVDYIGRVETIQESLNHICKQVSINNTSVPIPIERKSNRRHYSSYYDDEMKQLVAKKFKTDLNHFGYKFETGEEE